MLVHEIIGKRHGYYLGRNEDAVGEAVVNLYSV
jgi:hypothetical protein